MAVYIEVADTHPRTYALTDTPPENDIRGRWQGYQFTPTPEYVVYSKMYGSHEKAQPYVVRGISRGGRLLVQTLVATEYDPKDRWHEVEAGDTVEGYRFKRYVLKPVLTILKLATDAAKVAQRREREAVSAAERAEKCGTCPCCFGDYVATQRVVRGLGFGGREQWAMVHHGYERPGVGYIVGDCHGVNFEPFEVSCEGTKSWLNVLKQTLARTKDLLVGVAKLESVSIVTGTKYTGYGRRRVALPEYKTIKRGEPGFDREIESLRRKYEHQIESLKRDIAEYTKRITNWKPQPFPRKAA